MKKTTLIFLLGVFTCITAMAQAPQSFNYQAIARNGAGNILADQQISVKISLLQSSPEGEALYSESHKTLTNSFGLFSLKIGRGNTLKGNFSSLKWHENSHYIQIELDAEGGEDYQMMGTAELLSVPYALYAEHSGDGSRSNDYDWGSNFNNLFTGTGGDYPSGNVGIGITTPQAKLHVEGDILSQEIRSISTDQTSTERVVNNKIITTYAPQTQASVNATSFQIKAATEDATHSIGNTNQINGMKFSFIHRNNGSLNDFYGIRSQGGMPNGSWGGAGSAGSINNLTGLRSELYGEKGSVNYASNISLIKVGDNFSNYSYLQIGSSADVNGNYGIYNAAAYPNYFAGNTGLGTSNPQAMLHVIGKTLLQPSASSSTKIKIDNNSNNAEIVMYDESGTAATKLSSQGTSYINKGSLVMGNTTADASAALEVNSNSKGLLPPRMTMAQRDNITNPATGLMIYQTDNTATYYFYNGSQWEAIGSGELGLDDLTDAETDVSSLFLGQGSGQSDDGANQNTAIGQNTLHANTTGENNLAAGYSAMENNNQGGNNTALGSKALYSNINGNNNVAIGSETGYNSLGNNNTLIGAMAGSSLVSDSGNVFIGYGAGATLSCSNKLIINNNISGSPLIYGDFHQGYLDIDGDLSVEGNTYVALSSGNMGVGTTVPTEKLEVNGNILADTLSAETVYAGAFSSNSPLKLQTNNTTRIYVDDSEGKVGIGTTAPNASAALDVSSTTKGFLPPRLTTSARDNISNPEPGLMVYNTETWCINIYNGISWTEIGRDTACGFPITDLRDGQTYQTVLIGDQCWMAENLRATVYPNGEAIPYITDDSQWKDLGDNNTDDAYCYYENNPNSEYGALYTYAAAIADNWQRDNTDGQGICPDGWHLPTDSEWTALTNYLGGDYLAGGKMKETGTSHWLSPNIGATNESGFTALPGGDRDCNLGSFYFVGSYGYWWSVTEYNSSRARDRILFSGNTSVTNFYPYKSMGYSVRCLRDDE